MASLGNAMSEQGWDQHRLMVMDNIKRLSDNISGEVHKKMLKLKKKIAGSLLMVVGGIFLLIALALFINTLATPWLGYLIVAVVILLAGYLLTKE